MSKNIKRYKFTEEQIEQAVRDYFNGMTPTDIVSKHGISKTTLRRGIKKHSEKMSGFESNYNVDWSMYAGKNSIRSKKGYVTFVKNLIDRGHELRSIYVDAKTNVLIWFGCEHEPHTLTPDCYKKGSGCPKCSGHCPEQAREDFMNMLKNNGHTLLSEYVNNSTKVLIDFNCGHEPHPITPSNYKIGRGCPKCGTDNASLKQSEQAREEFMELIELNGHTLLSEYKNNYTKVLIDFNCGHEPHPITPQNYKQYKGCPKCNASRGEKIIYEYLVNNGHDVESQHIIDGYRYKYDLYIKEYNLIVEVHGLQHYEEVEHFDVTLYEQQEIDGIKELLAYSKGYGYMVVDYREHKPELALERFKKQFEEYKKA